jgi:hypothetical protein
MAMDYSYEADRDDRYHFKGFDAEIIRALGRLTLNASYLEGTMRTLLARITDNDDLALGERIADNGGFQWLVDHPRAVSEHKLDPALHQHIVSWLGRARAAYNKRNRIVHSEHAWAVTDGQMEMLWTRTSVKRTTYQSLIEAASADDVHAVAPELEQLGLEGVDLMDPIQKAAAGESWTYPVSPRKRFP